MVERTVVISEVYRDYMPPSGVITIVRELMDVVPDNYLKGLKEIVLTNVSALSRERRRTRTSKGDNLREARGAYHPPERDQAAWVEIFVDNTLEGWPVILIRFRFFLRIAIAEVLFHEIGHHKRHVLMAGSPDSKVFEDPERFAKKEAAKLDAIFFRKKYWYLIPTRYLARFISRFISRAKIAGPP